MNILNLIGYEVLRVEESEHDYAIEAMPTRQGYHACPNCISMAKVRKFGSLSIIFMDLPIHGKRVGIHINRQRFHCAECGKTYFEPLPLMDEKRHCTKRLIKYAANESLKRTFTSIAEETGVSEGTVRLIFSDYINDLDNKFRAVTPRWLGIDEVHLIKPRCVLTNVEQNTVVDILSNRDKKTVVNWLSRLPDRHLIQLVAIDMWRPYKEAVEFCLPQAKIVIDKYHVVQMANEALDKVRKELREGLTPKERKSLKRERYALLKRRRDLNMKEQIFMQAWCEQFPVLGIAYKLKEDFYAIWEQPTKINSAEAKALYDEWAKQIHPDVAEHFLPILTAFGNWEKEIFAYFESPITNAYTESLNSLIRVVDRMGRGYSFDVLRAKILYSYGSQKIVKPAYNRNAFRVSEDQIPLSGNRVMTGGKSKTNLLGVTRYGSNPNKLLLDLEKLELLRLIEERDQHEEV